MNPAPKARRTYQQPIPLPAVNLNRLEVEEYHRAAMGCDDWTERYLQIRLEPDGNVYISISRYETPNNIRSVTVPYAIFWEYMAGVVANLRSKSEERG